MRKIFSRSSKSIFIDQKEVIAQFQKLAKKIAKENKDVKRIFLFGSYAQGNAGFHSDADILVVLAVDEGTTTKKWDEFILAFADGPVPADVLVYSQAGLDREVAQGNRFLKRAVKGIALV